MSQAVEQFDKPGINIGNGNVLTFFPGMFVETLTTHISTLRSALQETCPASAASYSGHAGNYRASSSSALACPAERDHAEIS